MGIYSLNEDANTNAGIQDERALQEAFIFDELCKLSDAEVQAFIESDEAKSMLEAGILTKKTLVRLTKQDDLSRRMTMAAMQFAKEADDPLYHQLKKVHIKERELRNKINNKYSSKSQRVAKIGQKEYLKGKTPLAFMRPKGF